MPRCWSPSVEAFHTKTSPLHRAGSVSCTAEVVGKPRQDGSSEITFGGYRRWTHRFLFPPDHERWTTSSICADPLGLM